MDAPRNLWYAAAHSSELGAKPLGRILLGQPIVLFRQADNRPAALFDRCSHRMTPLSLGTVVGDLLRCGYHGALFDAAGYCKSTLRSGLDPEKCSIRAYPALELHGFVWVWPGDPARADDGRSIAPFLAVASDPNADVRDGGYISFAAPYELLVDNLMDATHAQFVHSTTLGCAGLLAQREDKREQFQVEIGERSINYTVDLRNGEAGRCFHEGLGRKYGRDSYDGPVDWLLKVQWQAPSFHIFSPNCKPAGASESEAMAVNTIHAITPETATSCHYFFKSVELVTPGGKSYNDFWADRTFQAFAEDKLVIEAQQKALGERKSVMLSPSWTMLASDDLATAARRIIDNMIEAEAAVQRAGSALEVAHG